MKYIAQFVFPSLGKVDRCIALSDFRDRIEVPLIERYIGIKPLELDELSTAKCRRMEFIFNGKQTPQNFELNGKMGWVPTSMLCEYEFNGIKD